MWPLDFATVKAIRSRPDERSGFSSEFPKTFQGKLSRSFRVRKRTNSKIIAVIKGSLSIIERINVFENLQDFQEYKIWLIFW